jgi:hypothetical protein
MKKKARNPVPRSLRRLFPQVTEVTDSREPVDIYVSAGDAKNGRQMQGDECAMAKAVVRQTKADGAVIGISASYIIKGTKAIRFKTSTSIGREITSFDRHNDFQPGEYRLGPVSESQSLGTSHTKREPHSGPSGPKDQHRIVHKETVNVRSFRKAG